MTRTAQIRARLDKATPGKWALRHPDDYPHIEAAYGWICQLWNKHEEAMLNATANAALIASAPEDIKWLLDRLEMAEKLLLRAERHLPMIGDMRDPKSQKKLPLSTEIAAFIGGEEK